MQTQQWKRGQFVKFYAKMKFRVGGANGSNSVDIQEGDELEYDGTILKYAGMEISQPSLRSAYTNGWISETAEDLSPIHSVGQSRNVAKSQSINTDLSKVQRHQKNPMATNSLDEEVVMDISERRGNGRNDQPRILTQDQPRSARGMSINEDLSSTQEGVSIGRVRTAAKIKVDMTTEEGRFAAQRITNMGVGRPDFNKEVVREGITIKSNLGSINRSVAPEASDEGEVVGKVRNSARPTAEGIEIKDTSSVRTGSNGNGVKAQTVSVPKPKIDTKINPRLRQALRIDPNFPIDWKFDGKLAERLERVKQHGATPEFLEALYAAEGDQFRKVLVKEFPKQFGA